jgi:hypothetical protein
VIFGEHINQLKPEATISGWETIQKTADQLFLRAGSACLLDAMEVYLQSADENLSIE